MAFKQVADTIFESVLPRHAGDILPTSDPGILLAIADRQDSLVTLRISLDHCNFNCCTCMDILDTQKKNNY